MPLPTWFLSHGAPSHLLEGGPPRECWAALPERLPETPRALLCLSAHWQHPTPVLATARTIQYDFHGFPEALYRIHWPLRDDPDTTTWLRGRLGACLGHLEEDPERPLDHGVWVPLLPAWPAPPFPVYQLTLPRDPQSAWDLGRRLAPLRAEGVLLVGSGGLTHNLRRLHWHAPPGQAEPWAATFVEAVEAALDARDPAPLLAPWDLPHGRDAHPTVEHYLPLLTALGAAVGEPCTPLLRHWAFATLALHGYAFGAP